VAVSTSEHINCNVLLYHTVGPLVWIKTCCDTQHADYSFYNHRQIAELHERETD